jgi:hypothetical protein
MDAVRKITVNNEVLNKYPENNFNSIFAIDNLYLRGSKTNKLNVFSCRKFSKAS